MAHPSTLFRFRIDLTDIDRSVYQRLDIRIPMHPSESETFLMTRVLAYALNYSDDLQFSKEGLGAPEDPTLSIVDPGGGYHLWIEIGNPSTKKLHKATKSSEKVKIYTYKNPALLIQDLHAAQIYQPERMELYSFSDQLLDPLVATLVRDNNWNLIHNEGGLMIQIGDEAIEGEVMAHSLEKLFK
jgi:uncharacterized protein YaeQ